MFLFELKISHLKTKNERNAYTFLIDSHFLFGWRNDLLNNYFSQPREQVTLNDLHYIKAPRFNISSILSLIIYFLIYFILGLLHLNIYFRGF